MRIHQGFAILFFFSLSVCRKATGTVPYWSPMRWMRKFSKGLNRGLIRSGRIFGFAVISGSFWRNPRRDIPGRP